jgi:putative salt-induced outer membrane protein YdiY
MRDSALKARNLLACQLTLATCLLSAPALAREKVDVIYLLNGDRVTGEIISLEYGQLSIKTDSMGTVLVEWPDVTSVDSKQSFILEDLSGGRYYGTLATDTQAKSLEVVEHGQSDPHRIELLQVTRISPGEATFWSRMQGSFSVGFDYTKSSDITTSSAAMDLSYRAPEFAWSFSADMNATKDPVQGTLQRDSVSYNYQWLRPHKRFWAGLSSLERNEETGIDARLTLGGGLGKYFVQTPRSEVSGILGVAFTQEWSTGTEDSQSSMEGLIGGSWRIFKFNTPKVSLNTTALLYPSITESGRYRTSLNLSLRREIISDFYLDLSLYQSYDSDPPDVTAEKDDYGITTSLGYSFY